jgi:hypothetical protein
VGQEGERKRSTDDVSKPIEMTPKPGEQPVPGMSLAGALLTGQVVSGMEVARAWPGLRCGTCEAVVPRPRAASGAVVACGRSWKGEPQAADPQGVEY